MIKIKGIEERIERYQHERNEQFARWNNYEVSRESARTAIGTLTRWIELLGSVGV
jgi:hypothetical protein